MSKFKPERTVADAITTIVSNVDRINLEARKAAGEDVFEPSRNRIRPGVLLISESNELRIFEGMVSKWSMLAGISLEHFNRKELNAADIRGKTLAAVVISKRLWGAQISQVRTLELRDGLTTVSTVLGLDVSDLVFYV